MRTKLMAAVCVAAITLCGTSPARADDNDALKLIADSLVVRPVCLVATAVGSAVFVISLPIAAISKSVKKAANILVVRPAKATFTRPLGDMEALES
jgi:hypothetical protein